MLFSNNKAGSCHQSSFANLTLQCGAPSLEKFEAFFNAIPWLNLNAAWFAETDKPNSAEKRADDLVPLSEDFYRSAMQLWRMLAGAITSEMMYCFVKKVFPFLDAGRLIALKILIDAIYCKKLSIHDAIIAFFNEFGGVLADIEAINALAVYLERTMNSWTGGMFLSAGPGEGNWHQNYIILAVVFVTAREYIGSVEAPQRALLRLPATILNLLLRTQKYYNAVCMIAHSAPPPEEPALLPAFEVDSSIALSLNGPEATAVSVAGGAQQDNIIYFSSNSTVNPEACTRATVENRTPETAEVAYSLAQKLHVWAIAEHITRSNLSGLQNCKTRQRITRELRRGEVIIHTDFNTQCDATARQGPLPAPVPVLPSRADEPPLRAVEPTPPPRAVEPTPPLRADEPTPQANDAAQRYDYNYANVGGAAALATGGVLPALTRALKTPAGLIVVTGTVIVGTGTVIVGVSTGIYKRLQSWLLPRPAGDEAAPPAEASSAEALRGDRQHQPTKAETSNIGLAGIMQSAGILDEEKNPASFRKEEIIAAVGITLFAPNPDIMYDVTRLDKRLEEVAKMILQAEKLYHGRADEKISAGRAGMVVRNWLFDNVLGMPVESWLASRVAVIKSPGDANALLLQRLLKFDALRSDGIIDTEGLSEGKKLQFEKFWNYGVDNTLSFTNRGVSPRVTEDNFVWLHTGSLLLKDAGATLSDFSVEECKAVGKALWQRVEAGDMDISYLRYLALPALLFEAVSHPKRVSHRKKETLAHRLKAVSEYVTFRCMVAPVYKTVSARVKTFGEASDDWEPRGKIAERYVEKCPESVLIGLGKTVNLGYVPGGRVPAGTKVVDPAELIRLGKGVARLRYLNGETPRGCPDASVTTEYERKTRDLANAFSAVEESVLAVAMGGLDRKELDFINSGSAVIRHVTPSIYPTSPLKSWRPALKNKNIFRVAVGKEKRIYAFVRNGDGEYAVSRLDRKIDNYFEYGIFDSPGDQSPQAYEVELTGFKSVIDVNKNAADDVVAYFVKTHGEELYRQLLLSGYDMTVEQTGIEFLKSIIPFYGCFNGNIVSCIIDVVSVIPVVGLSVNLAGKFGFSLYRAAKVGIKLLPAAAVSPKILNTVGRQALAQISLPTIPELAVLSKATIRALDPGFELITAVGKYSGAGLKTLFNKLRVGVSAEDTIKLNKVLTKALKKIEKPGATEQVISHEALLTEKANLPGTNIKVPVNIVGEAGGKNYYAIVDPETMEFLEEIYLIEKGELKLVRQRPDNWSPKNDISDHKLALPRKGENKVDAAAGPSKEEVLTSLCPTGGRAKRSLEELCQAKPFADKGERSVFEVNINDEILPSAYKVSLLRTVNPVRYKILQMCLSNLRDISLNAERVITEMNPLEIIKSFKSVTRTPLKTFKQAEILKVNVLNTIKAFTFFWANDATHIVVASLQKSSAALNSKSLVTITAAFLEDKQAMFIGDYAFDSKDQGLLEIALLHESSHVDECVDNFYYYKYPFHMPGVLPVIEASEQAGRDVMSYYIVYIKDKIRRRGFDSMFVGNSLKQKLGIDVNLFLKASDHRVIDGMHRLGITHADLMINNADTIALYILCLGHRPNMFKWKSAGELFQKAESDISFYDSVTAIGSED
ncbi:hypothetical protein [Erwinia pyrifoliae]|uniref:Uncharacterized protein n=1 Tax=Erwinia pyrifoliae TaxID=79967 RepID=A0ABY5X7B9_ERWPY|nr:hypothetical protein [Erwinia pyrifoliae]UWS33284.1 hypothetical protein NYP84_17135 [Erwinia pyrifoliae]UXK11976.1 hypothetical protein NYP80_17100 [Erwinia pyrifoliae]